MCPRLLLAVALVVGWLSAVPGEARAEWKSIRTLSDLRPIELTPDKYSYRLMSAVSFLSGMLYFPLTEYHRLVSEVNGTQVTFTSYIFKINPEDVNHLQPMMVGVDPREFSQWLANSVKYDVMLCEIVLEKRSDDLSKMSLGLECYTRALSGSDAYFGRVVGLTGRSLRLQMDQ